MKNTYSTISRYSFFIALLYLAIWGGASSCVSPKSIVYFQGDTLATSYHEAVKRFVPTIEPNDLLAVVVGSLSNEANEIFNIPNSFTTTNTNYSTGAGGAKVQPLGYLVDASGFIEVPLAGKIKVGGLRTSVAADTIRVHLLQYLKEPSIVVRNINFKVSILGEIVRPAIYVIPDETITLPEIMSLAGDLTIYGRRDNVLIIREENGVRNYARLDLTSRDIFNSPYYYVHKNDIIYVEPVKTRLAATDRRQQLVPVIASIIGGISTLGILILNLSK